MQPTGRAHAPLEAPLPEQVLAPSGMEIGSAARAAVQFGLVPLAQFHLHLDLRDPQGDASESPPTYGVG